MRGQPAARRIRATWHAPDQASFAVPPYLAPARATCSVLRLPFVTLTVRVNDDFMLDAGTVEDVRASELVIHPPRVTLFHQLLDYLRAKPSAPTGSSPPTVEDEGVAALAVALRWGSYLAVLVDEAKPTWRDARPGTSRISNSEMARINIEASAALAEWIDLARADRVAYEKLVAKALASLPMPKMRPTATGSEFAMLAMPEVASPIIGSTGSELLARVRSDAERHPSRVFANALVNVAWRNGPVEDLHAGASRGYPLERRRITTAEERAVLDFAADRLTTGMDVCRSLSLEQTRSWPEQVPPYTLARTMRTTPTGWTLTETTREVRLPCNRGPIALGGR